MQMSPEIFTQIEHRLTPAPEADNLSLRAAKTRPEVNCNIETSGSAMYPFTSPLGWGG